MITLCNSKKSRGPPFLLFSLGQNHDKFRILISDDFSKGSAPMCKARVMTKLEMERGGGGGKKGVFL